MTRPILTTAALLGIAIVGFFGILVLVEKNGWGPAIRELIDSPGSPLADFPDQPGRTNFTDYAVIDQLLTTLVRFFHPITTGNYPSMSLFSLVFVGQVVPLHAIFLLEGLRAGNKMTILWAATVWAQMYQLIPVGIWAPFWAIVHIWISPVSYLQTVKGGAVAKVALLSMDPYQLVSLPAAIVLGFLAPTALLAWPDLLGFDSSQIVIALWQLFPFWVGLWLFDIVVFVSAFDAVPRSAKANPAAKLRLARWTYRAVLLVTAAIHLTTLYLIFFPESLNAYFPDLDTSTITPARVFKPMSFIEPHQIRNFGEGVHTLLQWDMYCAVSAIFVFALRQVYVSFEDGASAVASTLVKSIWRAALVGPAGAALWAFADRDARLVEDAAAAQAPKKTQ